MDSHYHEAPDCVYLLCVCFKGTVHMNNHCGRHILDMRTFSSEASGHISHNGTQTLHRRLVNDQKMAACKRPARDL